VELRFNASSVRLKYYRGKYYSQDYFYKSDIHNDFDENLSVRKTTLGFDIFSRLIPLRSIPHLRLNDGFSFSALLDDRFRGLWKKIGNGEVTKIRFLDDGIPREGDEPLNLNYVVYGGVVLDLGYEIRTKIRIRLRPFYTFQENFTPEFTDSMIPVWSYQQDFGLSLGLG